VIPFFTIGHSTRPVEDFIALLAESSVAIVVDVRTVPRSRTNPQYNRDALPATLAAAGIGYTHLASLGGLRPRSRVVAPEVNGYWENASFHNYADYALSAPFAEGIAALRAIGHARRATVMCSEAVWWRCHRRIVADWLIAAGESVVHIMAPGNAEPATLTPAAVRDTDGRVTYPALL
jgi:uncharacterized protein (DUF488 family)